jgi:hypothetical protein
MATSWTLVVAAPLSQVAASVESLASKPALTALGDDATVARFESDAATTDALALHLRAHLGAVVDSAGVEGIRAVTSLDGVTTLAAARAAEGTWLVAPAAFSFAQVAAVFGSPVDPAHGSALKDGDDLSSKLTSAFQAREDPAAIEKRLRASRGVSEWGAVFGFTPAAPEAGAEGDAAEAPVDKDKLRDEMRATLREDAIDAIPEAEPSTTLRKSEGRRKLEEVLRGGGDEAAEGGATEPSATAEGGVGKA